MSIYYEFRTQMMRSNRPNHITTMQK